MGDLIACSEQFKDAEGYTERYTNGKDATIYAENELLGAASSIEAASVKLAQLKPRDVPTVGVSVKKSSRKFFEDEDKKGRVSICSFCSSSEY